MEPSADKSRHNEETQAAEPPLSEPKIIPCMSVSGVLVETSDHVVNLVGWVNTPATGGGAPAERRIVIRFDMPIDAIRPLRDALTKAIPRGH